MPFVTLLATAEVEAREGLGLWAGGQSGVDVGVLPAGIGDRQRIRAAVDHRALHSSAARAIAAGQGPRARVATLEPVAEVYRWSYSRPAQRQALGTASRVIGERQAGAARSVGTRGECYVDRARACRRKGTATTGARVGLRKVRRIRSSECDATDTERRCTTVGERHGLRSTGRSHILIAKADTRWT